LGWPQPTGGAGAASVELLTEPFDSGALELSGAPGFFGLAPTLRCSCLPVCCLLLWLWLAALSQTPPVGLVGILGAAMIPIGCRRNRRRACTVAIAEAALLALTVMPPSRGAAREIGPEANLCTEIHALPPGEELVLGPGEYQGPCAIRRGGEAGAPLMIRAADPKSRPRVVYGGRDTNVIEVRASHVTIRGLGFGPTQSDADAVRIFSVNDVTIDDCHFTRIGGIAVAANHSSVRGLVVRRDVIRDLLATAMYFGCHEGGGGPLGRRLDAA